MRGYTEINVPRLINYIVAQEFLCVTVNSDRIQGN
jgi:hypothetical protein